jgi:UDP-N-acetylmuramyl pentapeptide synthase
MLHLQCALPENVAAGHFTTKCELVERLIGDLRPGDVIAVKASMPSKMGTLVRMVRNLADAVPRSTADSRV